MVVELTAKYSIVVLPFLKTDRPASIGSIMFRSTTDMELLTASQAESVNEIADMLFLKDDFRIRSATYAIVPEIDVESFTHELAYLRNVQSVITYIYTAPRHEFGDIFLTPEHASVVSLTLLYSDRFFGGSYLRLWSSERRSVSGYSL